MVAVALLSLPGVAASVPAEVVIETVTVGNPANAGELSGECVPNGDGPCRECGTVEYVYKIGKFEVTAGQYTEFLNAVAAGSDMYGLYEPDMWYDEFGCKIERTGSSYAVAADWANRPVNHVSWASAARFANWMHNGQPTGPQDLTTTEDGSYYLNGATSNEDLMAVVREPDATWVIPSEDEWYKAAYHYNDGVTGNYWDYPTQSDTAPTSEAPPGMDMTNGSANCWDGSDWAIGSPYYRTEVGAYDAKPSDSPYGTFDQGGNVWEWNEAVIDSYRGLRGGSFHYTDYGLHAAKRDYRARPTGEMYHEMGFRVAEVEPEFVCGDGVIEVPEECDDHNTDDGDGCSSTCTVEDGWVCEGEPSVCTEIPVPAVSEWGLVVMVLLVLMAGTVAIRRRRQLA
jgi:cysteine-rich repeat protein